MSYADAVVLLGGTRGKIVLALDRLLSGTLLDPSAPASGFGADSQLFKLSQELVAGLPEKLRGVSRFTRSQHLAAAHSIIVFACCFNELRPVDHRDFDEVTALLRMPIPWPTPDQPYADAQGQVAWIHDENRQIYDELLGRLADDFPELASWVNLPGDHAIRGRQTALAGLAVGLEAISTGRPPDPLRGALANVYQAALRRPVLSDGQPPGDVRVPSVEDSYVNPDFRVARGPSTEEIADKDWWAERPRRTDLQEFLIGYLTNPTATEAPLVVLGQPGSGKSLLTQVLAARLPAKDFLTVRVPLREVPADADPQTQIEQAIRAATGETLTWPQLARSAGDALPVVLLDGFDELLQATGISQSNYLEKVASFQQREADQARPVVVVVTTRMSVADRARPVDNMLAVLLEPFDDKQIERWLTVWHDTNKSVLASPLPLEVALAHRDLAKQPLLLLMLALYDADGNPLQRQGIALGEAELYERLLTGFARREVLKSDARLPDNEWDRAVERELLQLSIVAFAMFNRQQLWVTEAQLQADLSALLPEQAGELTRAQIVVGRFYFVHVAQADEKRLKTYEFLHATFGEYLVARLVVQELTELASTSDTTHRSRPRVLEDYFLHALLSFLPLTMRVTVVDFIADLVASSPDPLQERMREVLLQLFHVALEPRRTTSLDDYQPIRATATLRCAAYSANLCLLATITANDITSRILFPGSANDADEWTRMARLWQSQLPAEGWLDLASTVAVLRGWNDERREVVLRYGLRDDPQPTDPFWFNNFPRLAPGRIVAFYRNYEQTRTEADFICGLNEDTLIHNLEPLLNHLGPAITTFHVNDRERPVSAAHALITLWLASTHGNDRDALVEAFDMCLEIALHGFSVNENGGRRDFRILVLRQIAADRHRLPESWLNLIPKRVRGATEEQLEFGILLKDILRMDING